MTEARLRFDFAWDEALTAEQLAAVEAICNDQVRANFKVFDKVTPLEQAKAIYGLRAVFGEAYPDPVRVVSVGVDVDELLGRPESPDWAKYSIEFCGGTHLPALGDAELLVITDESSCAAGVRRISAVTRQKARDAVAAGAALEARVAEAEGLEAGKELAEAVKGLKKEAQAAAVGQVAKYAALARVAALDKKCAGYLKGLAKELEKAALEGAAKAAEGLPKDAKRVVRLDFGNNGKVNSAVTKVLTKAAPGGSFLVVSVDSDADAICVYASCLKVPPPSLCFVA